MTIDRRTLLAGASGMLLAGGLRAAADGGSAGATAHGFRIVTDQLLAPEGPKPQADGSVIVCEMARGTLSRVMPGGRVQTIATLGGAPNGVAIGPDGAAYVCNNGGFKFRREGRLIIPSGPLDTPGAAVIQRVDLRTGRHAVLYRSLGDAPLKAPNDLVFDGDGGFWFTDPGAPYPGQEGGGTVNYARADGSGGRVVCGLVVDNGIALSPDGRTLYVARTLAAEVVAYTITAPGQLATDAAGRAVSRVVGRVAGKVGFDSLAVDEAGNLLIGTLNFDTTGNGAITVMAPDGRVIDSIGMPENFVTSVGFGGRDRRTAYVTLTQSGRLARLDWPRPGVRLAYQ